VFLLFAGLTRKMTTMHIFRDTHHTGQLPCRGYIQQQKLKWWNKLIQGKDSVWVEKDAVIVWGVWLNKCNMQWNGSEDKPNR
jgi:hypothetical protein